VITKKRNQYSS